MVRLPRFEWPWRKGPARRGAGRRWPQRGAAAAVALVLLAAGGCSSSPTYIAPEKQEVVDRAYVVYPPGTELRQIVSGLMAPSAIAWDAEGSLLIAESGVNGKDPHIFGFKKDGEFFEVYPREHSLLFQAGFRIYGPVGGMVASRGNLYVSHRDEEGYGAITVFMADGSHKTVVSQLPARGDFGVTDLAIAQDGRLYFGVGAATNSGVVGVDNLDWLRRSRDVYDQPWAAADNNFIYLAGLHFNTPNPFSGLFGGSDIAVTAPFQPFAQSLETRISRDPKNKPNAAIFSVDPAGGPVKVEAFGIRDPAGLCFNDLGRLYFTNQGMKLHGSRPVKDDPDVLLKLVSGQWYGWPDFTANLLPIHDPKFQPPMEMLVKSGYRELTFVIDQARSQLVAPRPRQSNLLAAEFQPLSGAAKFDFVPGSGPFARLRQGRSVAIVALSGDRTPFDSGGLKLTGPIGYKLVLVNVDNGQTEDYIRNTREGPASQRTDERIGLERPVDVKFGPDGALYILDYGQMKTDQATSVVKAGTGAVYRLAPAVPTTAPTHP